MARKGKDAVGKDSPFFFDEDLEDEAEVEAAQVQPTAKSQPAPSVAAVKPKPVIASAPEPEQAPISQKESSSKRVAKPAASKSAAAKKGRRKVDAYRGRMDKRYGLEHRSAVLAVLAVLAVALVFVCTLLPTNVLTSDTASEGLAGYFDSLGYNLQAFSDWVAGTGQVTGIGIIFFQTIVIAVVGAALALNGAVYQGAMKNPLASPSTLGVMSGGTLGATIYAFCNATPVTSESAGMLKASEIKMQLEALSVPDYIMAVYGRSIYCIIGCMAVVGLILLISHLAGRNGISKTALVIAGQVFTAIVASAVTALKYWALYNGSESQFWAIQYLQTSSVSMVASLTDMLVIVIPLLVVFAVIALYTAKLNLLAFSDDEAKALGLKPTRIRNFIIIMCTISTAVVVSFCGTIAYVGFLVPHLARKIVGPDFRFLIPASMLLGAVYVLVANYIMNFSGILPGSLGTFTSVLGIVFFIVVVIVQRARGNADWV